MFPRCSVAMCMKTTVVVIFFFQVLYIPLTVFLYWRQPPKPLIPPSTVTPRLQDVPTTVATLTNETVEYFLWEYAEYCYRELNPKHHNVETWSAKTGRVKREVAACPCVSDTLVGLTNRSTDVPLMGELELRHPELLSGGEWLPKTCIPRQRVAIIIPFRDREDHLRALLAVLHPMLQRQLLHYTIFVVEQLKPAVFNKAALMNAGFAEARLIADFDCYIFHDVDMIPLHDHNFYTCSEMPRHVGSHLDKFNFTLPYVELFGGVTAFIPEHFVQVNGYSNRYYGWGGEDDDMYSRIVAQNLSIVRFSSSVARYSMIKHQSDDLNPANSKRFSLLYHRYRLVYYQRDGLNNVRYKLNAFEARPLYMWLQIVLPPHPLYFQNTYLMKRDCASTSTIQLSGLLVMIVLSILLIDQ